MQIEIADHHAVVLRELAAARGLTLDAWLGKLAEDAAGFFEKKPLKTGRGVLAQYSPAPSADEIDENRREMFRNFA